MKIMKFFRTALLAAGLALGASASFAGTPGCVGKMWNPIGDLDFRLMGGIKIMGIKLMGAPSALGEPPNHSPKAICFCKDGLQTGFGLGLSFWMPSYINDVARQAGCMGFLNGINILPGFMSQSSGQEYNHHKQAQDGVTNMQIHWAYADVTAIAGKSLFEKCNAVTGSMQIAYLTEPDFIFQNDVYSAIMTPQVALLAAVPLLSQMTCAYESIANTLGDWQDWGVCGWKGSRLPLSGNTIAKDSAQVSNMDITVKYLTRSAMMGTTMRTMGKDATCRPQYSIFYDPFQHRYQWAYPGKVATRFNIDVMRWGMFIKDTSGVANMMSLGDSASQFANMNTVNPNAAPSGNALGMAENLVKSLPKPLNYPSKEAGYMQVWEARQCCLMVLTIEGVIRMILENLATMGNGLVAELYAMYNLVDTVYTIVTDPIGAALGFVGDLIGEGLGQLADMTGLSNTFKDITGGIGESMGISS